MSVLGKSSGAPYSCTIAARSRKPSHGHRTAIAERIAGPAEAVSARRARAGRQDFVRRRDNAI